MGDESGPIDAFEQLGHPARMSILRALLEVRRSSSDPHVAFTELQDRSGIDDRGRFNYHLDHLLEAYVDKTDAGYRLSAFGHRVLAPVVAGLYDRDRDLDPVEVPGACPECGASLRVRSRERVLRAVCTEGHTVNQGLIGYPTAIGERSTEDAVEALGLLNAHAIELAVNGVCPTCHGPVDGTITSSDDGYLYRAPCDTCGNRFAASVADCVSVHPAVVAFLADRDVADRGRIPWEFGFGDPAETTVASEDPLRVRVDIEADDETLAVVVDRDGTVVSTERSATE